MEYLVSHGCAGSLGRFRAAEAIALRRGDNVVIRGRRGLELGTVLGQPLRASLPDEFIGELIRAGSEADRNSSERNAELSRRICVEAEELIASSGLPFTVIDAEVLLDGRSAVLHGISHAACDMGPVLEQLGIAHDLIVRLYDLAGEAPTPEPAEDHEEAFKCDKPDCGEGECTDCGTDGGCNSCSAGGAQELANHFAELREQMEKSRVRLV
ncbi:MAG: hypothetical protein ACJ8C4_10360 [Gemmataceae bacterium]